MNLTYFANAVSEIFGWPKSPIDVVIKGGTLIFGVSLAFSRFKQYLTDRKAYKKSEEIVNRAVNRPVNRKPLPPHSWESEQTP